MSTYWSDGMETFGIGGDNLHARYAMEFYISGVISLLRTWLRESPAMPVEEVAELIQSIMKYGVLKQISQ